MTKHGAFFVYGGRAEPAEGTRTITPIIQNDAYGLYVRRTYIKQQWHIELIRKMPEYSDPLITEFFLTPDELQLLRESLQ